MSMADRARSAVRASIRLHRAPFRSRRQTIIPPADGKLIARMVECQSRICPACDLWLEFDPDFDMTHPLRPSIDHVVPRSKGGSNVGNRIVMHRECNCAKGNRMPTGCERIWLASVNARLGVQA